jgi:glycosyltransferase involved in cell wall biosynthesis
VAVIAVTHFFTWLRSLGGVQSMLRRHLEQDVKRGCPSQALTFFETDDPPVPRTGGLGLTWRSTIAAARRRFRRRIREFSHQVSVYHNLWGLHFLTDLDGSQRRIGVLHSDWTGIAPFVEAAGGLLDGVLCVSEPLRGLVQRCLPCLEADRVRLIPYPVNPIPVAVTRTPLVNRPVVLGFDGRIVKAQKRVDRFPALVECLDRTGVRFRLEFLGEGPDLPRLQRRFKRRPEVVFHGRRQGEAYWRILHGWDFIVFVSDYEGLPITLLEAMSAGVLPVYPRVNSGGDPYVSRVSSEFLYAPEDFAQVATALRELTKAPESRIAALREACRQLVLPHLGDNYERVFTDFVRWITQAPRVSATVHPPRPFFFTDHCPFGILCRTFPRGYYRRASA